jgi:hypothetical protein
MREDHPRLGQAALPERSVPSAPCQKGDYVTDLLETIRRARAVGVPLIAVSTADPYALQAKLKTGVNGSAALFSWDCVRGMLALNERATDLTDQMGSKATILDQTVDFMSFAVFAQGIPQDSIVLAHNAHKQLETPNAIQAVSLLRDSFKTSARMLVLAGTSWILPAELASDVVVLDEALPDDAELGKIVTHLHDISGLKKPDDMTVDKAVASVRGLSAFGAEQVVALSLRKAGLDQTEAWERKKTAISQVRGLELEINGPTFEGIGGLQAACEFGARLFAGPCPPRVVVRLDEIEKAMAGSEGDLSGISQDCLGAWLAWMEDKGHSGIIAVGPAGAGKTLFSRSLGATHQVPTVAVDLGAMRGSLVGESERYVREALRTIEGLAAGRAFVIATCNKLDVLPPELRRRFKAGIWFFDLPSAEERERIWQICQAKYATTGDRPRDEGWSGAEIRNVCELSYQLAITLEEASRYIVPVIKAAPEVVSRLRESATGRFLCASRGGPYHAEAKKESTGCKMALGN